MRQSIEIVVDGTRAEVERGTTVAAALISLGVSAFRRSVAGAPRGPLCGMGACFECRVTIDGISAQRACMTVCEPDMEVVTDA